MDSIEPAGADTRPTRELGFVPRDPTDTLYDTVRYIRERFMGSDVLTRAS